MAYKFLKKGLSTALLISFVSINLNSCTKGPILGCSRASTNPTIPIKTLLESPETLEINGNKFTLFTELRRVSYSGTASAWPLIKNDECPTAVFSIFSLSGSNETLKHLFLPAQYKYEYMWILNNQEVWESKLEDKRDNSHSDTGVIGGPDWKADVDVIAIVKIRDSQGKTYFIKSKPTKVGYIV